MQGTALIYQRQYALDSTVAAFVSKLPQIYASDMPFFVPVTSLGSATDTPA